MGQLGRVDLICRFEGVGVGHVACGIVMFVGVLVVVCRWQGHMTTNLPCKYKKFVL